MWRTRVESLARLVVHPDAVGQRGLRHHRRESDISPIAIGTRDPALYQPERASGAWLAIPLGIMVVMLLTALGIVGFRSYMGKRAYDTYIRERRMPFGPKV